MNDVVVVVLPAQAWRVDAALLTDTPGTDWAIVADARSLPLLDAGRFIWAEATDDFSPDRLADILLRHGAAGPNVRLITNNETTIRATARVRERLGLEGPREAHVHHFLNKPAMKQRLATAAPDLLPRWRIHDARAAARHQQAYIAELVGSLGLPVFAKPTDGVGADGTARLADNREIERFLATAEARPYEFDEYLAGTVFNSDAVIHNGKVEWFGVCELLTPPSEVLERGAALVSWTLAPDEPDFRAMRAMTDRVILALDPPDGAIHLEGVRTAHGFRFLEVACRQAGWLIPDAYLASESVDLRVGHLHAAAGLAPKMVPLHRRTGGYFAAIKTRPGLIIDRHAPELAVPHRWSHRAGRPGPAPSTSIMMDDFVFELVAWHDDAELLRDALHRLSFVEPYSLTADACADQAR